MQEKEMLDWIESHEGKLEVRDGGYYLTIPGFQMRFGKTLERVYDRVRPMVEAGVLKETDNDER